MNRTIFLSCLVVVIGSLLWTASAQNDFEADREQVLAIFKGADPGSISDSNVRCLVRFLANHNKEIELTITQKTEVDKIVKQYNEEKDKPTVEGAQAQGGWITKLVRAIVVQLGIEIASEGVKKATKS